MVVTTPRPPERKAAIAAGHKTYFTGLPCKNGHVAPRYVGGACVLCSKALAAANKATRRERYRTRYVASRLFRSAKRRALDKNLPFNITLDDIVVPENCPVFGITLMPGSHSDQSPSLDRIDNSRGYVVGNIAVISWKANRLKNNATIEELAAIAAYAAQHVKGN